MTHHRLINLVHPRDPPSIAIHSFVFSFIWLEALARSTSTRRSTWSPRSNPQVEKPCKTSGLRKHWIWNVDFKENVKERNKRNLLSTSNTTAIVGLEAIATRVEAIATKTRTLLGGGTSLWGWRQLRPFVLIPPQYIGPRLWDTSLGLAMRTAEHQSVGISPSNFGVNWFSNILDTSQRLRECVSVVTSKLPGLFCDIFFHVVASAGKTALSAAHVLMLWSYAHLSTFSLLWVQANDVWLVCWVGQYGRSNNEWW